MAKPLMKKTAIGWKPQTQEEIDKGLPPIPNKFKTEPFTSEELAQQQQGGKNYISEINKAQSLGMGTARAREQALSNINANLPETIIRKQIEQQAVADKIKQEMQTTKDEARKRELAGILAQIGKQPQQTQTNQIPTAQTPTPLSDVSGGIKTENGIIVTPEQMKGTIPSELALPLTMASTPMAFGSISTAGAIATTPTATTQPIPTNSPATTLWAKIKGNQILTIGSIWAVAGKISGDRKQKVKEASAIYQSSKSNIASIITATNKGQISPEDAVMMYNEEWDNIYRQERNLKALTQTDLTFFIESNGKDELAKNIALQRMKPILDTQLRQAMIKPNLNAVNTEFGITEPVVEA